MLLFVRKNVSRLVCDMLRDTCVEKVQDGLCGEVAVMEEIKGSNGGKYIRCLANYAHSHTATHLEERK